MDLLISPIPELHSMNPEIGEGPSGDNSDAAIAFEGGRFATWGRLPRRLQPKKSWMARGVCFCLDWWTATPTVFSLALAPMNFAAASQASPTVPSWRRAAASCPPFEPLALQATPLWSGSWSAGWKAFLRSGVTTVEVKSGYGLSVKEELRLCRIIGRGGWPVSVHGTFLGAHAIPAGVALKPGRLCAGHPQ